MARLSVEVVYALPAAQDAVTVRVAPGATVLEAIAASGILDRHPELDLKRLGIFGRTVAPDTPVVHGDRVEIYRPLALDPKEARRRRARMAR